MIQTTEIEFIRSMPYGDREDIWCIKHELGKAYNGYLKEGNLVWEEILEGSVDTTKITPFLRIPWRFPLQEFVDALTKKQAVPTTKQAEIDAELKATKFHLEDMRKLVFKENK